MCVLVLIAVVATVLLGMSVAVPFGMVSIGKSRYYGRPLSVSVRPCYILPMFYYLFSYFLWPPYSPTLVNGGSRKFYTWWNMSVIREVTTWIFSWSSLN